MAQLEGLSLLGKLTISLGLISASLFPLTATAQQRILVPVPPPGRSTQAPPTPPAPDKEEEPDEEEEEPAEPSEETTEPSEEPAEPEEGGGTEQIAPKSRTL